MNDFEKHRPKMKSLALKYCRNNDVAEDIVQDAMVLAFRHKDVVSGSPLAWLLTIVKRRCFDYFRHKSRRPPEAEWPKDELGRDIDLPDIAHEPRIEDEFEPEIRLLLESLDPKARELIGTRLDGASYDDIAAMYGVPVGTVRSRISRAMKAVERLKSK